ncbi:MAG: bifunctional lysylphosphatidylglycerol flippase/synthetase MprF [Spirochaetaceae bacterium]|nr:bifunctional lysylphosphatidylglycerol flippase/synthetase MprF [Spirochaetaceae bacterium]
MTTEGDVAPVARDAGGALRERLLAVAGPVAGLGLVLVAAAMLRHEFRIHDLADVREHLRALPPTRLALAMVLTACGYLALTGYDVLALRYVGRQLPYPRVALASFVAYVFSHNVGLSIFGGSAVRFRMLSGWGMRSEDVTRVIVFTSLTFWTGFLALGGVLHTFDPIRLAIPGLPLADSRALGLVLIGAILGYAVLVLRRRTPFSLHGIRIPAPSPGLAAAQVTVSSVDWLLAASVFYVLLPETSEAGFVTVLSAFLVAQVIGLVSHVPGGLGVFETTMVLLLKPWLAGDEVLATAVAYRVVYYLLPFVLALALLAGYELRRHRALLQGTGARVQDLLTAIVPRFFAVTIFLSGVVLLVSGATPELPERLHWLRRAVPLPLLEVSKLAGSLAGVGLLFLSHALRQRLDAGWVGTLVLLGAGAILSLAKGLDWEEASVLTGMALLLWPCRRYFHRRSSLLDQPLSAGWWMAALVAMSGTVATLELAFRHVEYSHELWWQFAHSAEAPRALRATFTAALALAALGSLRLLRPARRVPAPPSPADLDRAQAIVASSPTVGGYLALLGDKELLFGDTGRAFLMYGVRGRTWVAMGDPVGDPAEGQELAWRFLELADHHGGRAAFYEVSEENLPLYLDLGLDLRKIGEEGRVPLATFSLEGRARKGLRASRNRLLRDGYAFELVAPPAVPAILDRLESLSNDWLVGKRTREKRFSLGRFDRDYLCRLPVAIVRQQDEIVAFANIWSSEAKGELSIDLMRYGSEAPPGVMDFLFTELMLWGQREGHHHFSLGMAPLAGLEGHRLAPTWHRVGALLFRHGEHFYNFQGLRAFKDKFDPEWAPRYLASPGALSAPLVLARIASLVSGGLVGLVGR